MDVLDGLTCTVVVRGSDPVLRDHRVHGTRILPGVSFLDMIYRVLRARGVDTAGAELRRVLFRTPVAAGTDFDTELTLRFTAAEGHHLVSVTGTRRPAGGVEPVLDCQLHLDVPFPADALDLAGVRARTTRTVDMAELYATVRATGITHGEFMQARGVLHVGTTELLAELSLGPQAAGYTDYFHLHPAALDSSTLLPTQFGTGDVDAAARPYIPMLIESFRARGPIGSQNLVHTTPPRPTGPDGDLTTCDITFHDPDGGTLLWLRGLTSKRVREEEAITRLDGTRQPSPTTGGIVRGLVAARLGTDEFDEEVGFYELGLDSTALLGIAGDLERVYGTDFSPTLLFEHNTVAALVGHLGAYQPVAGGWPPPGTETDPPAHAAAPAPAGAPGRANAPGPAGGPHRVDVPASAGAPGRADAPAPAGGPHRADEPAATDVPAEVVWFAPDWRTAPLPPAPPPAAVLTVDATTPRDWPALLAGNDARDMLWLPADPQDLDNEAVALTGFAAAVLRSRTGPLRLVCHLSAAGPVAAVTGLFRTLMREQSNVRAAVVCSPRRADALAELAAGVPDVDVRYATGERQVRVLAPVPAPDRPARLRHRGVYLITGGLGGVGLALARHLARTVAARLVLCGRTAADPSVTAELTGLGAEVVAVVADVTRRDDVRRAVDTAVATFGALHGVVHAAGVLRDGLIVGKSAEDVRAVLAPKTAGARHLHEATGQLGIDFLVLCSSTAAAWGNPGQADYACANAFLDGFAEGRPGVVSVAWPAWADGGMPVDPDGLRRMGLRAMPTPTAVDILLRAVGSGRSHLVALVGDPARIDAQFRPADADAVQSTGTVGRGVDAAVGDAAGGTGRSTHGTTVVRGPGTAGADDAVAIVGISGRYPMARDLDEFWANLRAGRDCITEVPPDRWDHRAIHTGERGVPGRSYGRWGGFVDGVDEFDAAFFHVSPNEAAVLDPQERIFLQAAWHAFEEAGHAPSAWRGRAVGVFAGVMYNQYQLYGVGDEPGLVPSSFSASIANRVSFFLDLRGPSLALDSMCSSSLTAIHLAVQAIRRGECEAALAGGVNLAVHPNKYLLLSQSSFLSTDGRCRAFGAGGDGYVPGEGVGVVLLRPLRDALRDGDHVHAIVRGTTLNHGGRTAGFSVPNPASQAALVAESLTRAALDPAQLGYLEAHGTGTSLGDPIEVAALEQAFDRLGADRGPWPIGSVKSNIGHLESAAGIAAVTKVVLQLRHRELVPSLHADPPNPTVDWAGSRFRVQRTAAPWAARGAAPRTATISSFGAGGANAHVVLTEHPVPAPVPEPPRPRLFVLSAKDATRLDEQVAALLGHLERPGGDALPTLAAILLDVAGLPVDPGEPLAELGLDYPKLVELGQRVEETFGVRPSVDGESTLADLAAGLATAAPAVDPAALAFTLWHGRDHLDERLAVVAASTAEFVGALRTGTGCHRGRRQRTPAPPTGDDLTALARAWVTGAEITVAPPAHPRRLSLPGYPFARDRHWVATGRADRRRRTGLVELPDGHVVTARISPADQPWLADHVVDGVAVVPGTFLVELALHAGARLGCPRLAELVTEVPLPFGAVDLRLVVRAPAPTGERGFELHARTADGPWARHATGLLAPARDDLAAAPPLAAGAEEVDVTDVYRSVGYGPAFQGLRRAWRAADTVWADVVVPDGGPGPYLLHPVLLDAALHAVAVGGLLPADRTHLPFAWSGVSVHTPGATAARAWVTRSRPDRVAVRLTDAAGGPVATVEAVTLRPAGAPADPLHHVGWVPVDTVDPDPDPDFAVVGADPDGFATALAAAGIRVTRAESLAALRRVPPVVALPVGPGGSTAQVAHARTRQALDRVRQWLADDRFAAARLVFVTGEPDPATAAVRGLVRSAQSEHPGRFVLVDTDDVAVLPRALNCDEPELSVRDGRVLAARLARLPAVTVPERQVPGTVLVTGASGGLAGPVVRHLVQRYGVRDVLLVSRSGRAPAGLSGLAARIEVAACDVADRDALAAVLAGRSVTMVLHAAGVLDDGVVTGLDAERLAAVLRPKVDGAANLAALLPDAELVFFSSAAGVLGGPGQANYAAANAFLDALARQRVAAGGRAVSLAWGPWATGEGMAADRHRLARAGIEPLPVEAALRLFDAALAGSTPDVVPIRLAAGRAPVVPHLLRDLVPSTPAGPAGLDDRAGLDRLDPDQRRARLATLVRQAAAGVLGHPDPGAIDPDRSFQELGFDSLSSVEFRNRLGAALGLPLEATLVFDHPTPADLTDHLADRFTDGAAPGDPSGLLAAVDRLAGALTTADDVTRERAARRLGGLLADLAPGTASEPVVAFDDATDDEVFALIDAELGGPLSELEERIR